jgi:hypothetical protein
MYSIAGCAAVAVVLAIFAHIKGRTGWHWLVLAISAYAAIWLSTVVTLDLAGLSVPLSSGRLALYVGALAGIVILIILVSVPARPRRRVASSSRRAAEMSERSV